MMAGIGENDDYEPDTNVLNNRGIREWRSADGSDEDEEHRGQLNCTLNR